VAAVLVGCGCEANWMLTVAERAPGRPASGGGNRCVVVHWNRQVQMRWSFLPKLRFLNLTLGSRCRVPRALAESESGMSDDPNFGSLTALHAHSVIM
jgi:hypothetical protein